MRRVLLAVAIAATAIAITVAVAGQNDGKTNAPRAAAIHTSPSTSSSSTTTTTTTLPIPGSDGPLALIRTVTGDISPKSVVASGRGQVFAQNMMYKHTVTVYDRTGTLVKTIPDTVDLAAFGIPGHAGVSRGAPVEVAFSPDGAKAYISNYSMYGAGFGPEGSDNCHAGDGTDTSFVYRIDIATLATDAVIPVTNVATRRKIRRVIFTLC